MKTENNWKYKSLFNLEKTHPDDRGEAPTRLVARCAELIKIPLNEYSIEDLRLMIGQGLGLPYLIPLAIEKLTKDLFAEGDMYEGDLLANVLRIPSIFWKQNPKLWEKLNELIAESRETITDMGISLTEFDM
jgi:hypothetical protein